MDFDKYKTNLPYPRLVEFLEPLKVRIYETKLTEAERTQQLEVAKVQAAEMLKSAREKYGAETQLFMNQFWVDAWREVAVDFPMSETQKSLLESWAWDDGHSCGLSEVFSSLQKLTDRVSQLLKNIP
jgi:hypothetical protein